MNSITLPKFSDLTNAIYGTWKTYQTKTDTKAKLIDIYIIYIICTALVQYLYVICVGSTYPYNSLLTGIFTCVGSFVLAVSLRSQTAKSNIMEYNFSVERAFADFIMGNILLFFISLTFIG